MVSVIEEKNERERKVIELYNQNKSTHYIAEVLKMSLRYWLYSKKE